MAIPSFKLLDGTTIPWLAWGNGTGGSRASPIETGSLAIDAGIRHIDTAQGYKNEKASGDTIVISKLPRSEFYVTSKLSKEGIKKGDIRASVNESLERLGSTPDLFLIHSPFVPAPGELIDAWRVLEELKDEGVLKSIGVSNFRPQDLEAVLAVAKHKPVVNQIEFHPYLLTHLAPVLELQKTHGIVTESYGPLTPLLRHPDGGPVKPILERIAKRLTAETGKPIDAATVLLLWTRAVGVVAVSASGNAERIKQLAVTSLLPDLLTKEEVDEITEAGKKVHFRHYKEHMTADFPEPALPQK